MKRTNLIALVLTLAMILASSTMTPVLAQTKVIGPTDRTVLPIPEPKVPHSTVFNAAMQRRRLGSWSRRRRARPMF